MSARGGSKNDEIKALRLSIGQRDAELSSLRGQNKKLEEALVGLADAVADEVDGKPNGSGGRTLARLADARAALQEQEQKP